MDYGYNCPDRCDIEIDYDWNHTNQYLDALLSDPQYTLSYGDKIQIKFIQRINPKRVIVKGPQGELELEKNEEGVWEGSVPKEWRDQGTFSVIGIKDSCRMLFYQGVLNPYKEIPYTSEACNFPEVPNEEGNYFLEATRDPTDEVTYGWSKINNLSEERSEKITIPEWEGSP